MMERSLRAALLKLHGKEALPASQFSAKQRQALDDFIRRTGALICQRQGRGDLYRVSDAQLFATHLQALSPQVLMQSTADLPQRAQHIAYARGSKAGSHQHDHYYPLLKAVGDGVSWHNPTLGHSLPLSQLTQAFGAASLCIATDDDWHSEQPLWLIENQALFDRSDWLPPATKASLLYYGGQIDGRLLAWLASGHLGQKPRASKVVLFPDYDGVGLANFARLYAQLGDACEFWLRPGWPIKLARDGSQKLWRDTFKYFTPAVAQLPDYLKPLTDQMRQTALALEQEAVWLAAE